MPGPAVGEHLAHQLGDLAADRAVDLLDGPAEALVDRAAVSREHGPVDPPVAQARVEVGEPDGGALPQRVEEPDGLVPRSGVGHVLQDAEHLPVRAGRDADPHGRPGRDVGERAARPDPAEDAGGARAVERHRVGDVPTEHLAGGPARQGVGGGTPDGRPPVRAENHDGDRQGVERSFRRVVGSRHAGHRKRQ